MAFDAWGSSGDDKGRDPRGDPAEDSMEETRWRATLGTGGQGGACIRVISDWGELQIWGHRG